MCLPRPFDQYTYGRPTLLQSSGFPPLYSCVKYYVICTVVSSSVYPAVTHINLGPCTQLIDSMLSLGVEPVDKDIMTRPPRRAKDPMITFSLLAQVVGAAMMIVMGTLYVFRREVSTCLHRSYIAFRDVAKTGRKGRPPS